MRKRTLKLWFRFCGCADDLDGGGGRFITVKHDDNDAVVFNAANMNLIRFQVLFSILTNFLLPFFDFVLEKSEHVTISHENLISCTSALNFIVWFLSVRWCVV